MSRTRQWYYNGSAIGGATGKTHTLTSGQTDSDLIECRTEVIYGTDAVAALAEYESAASFSISNTANPAAAFNEAGGGAVTFSAVDVGTASADREVYVAVNMLEGPADGGDISGVTIGGNAATPVVDSGLVSNGSTAVAAIYKYNLTSGTTADIVVSLTQNFTGVSISVFDVKGRTTEATNSATATTGSSISANVNTQAGGALIVAAVQDGSASGFSLTPTGYTITNQVDLDTSTTHDSSASGWNSSTSAATPATVSLATNSDPYQFAAIAVVAIS